MQRDIDLLHQKVRLRCRLDLGLFFQQIFHGLFTRSRFQTKRRFVLADFGFLKLGVPSEHGTHTTDKWAEVRTKAGTTDQQDDFQERFFFRTTSDNDDRDFYLQRFSLTDRRPVLLDSDKIWGSCLA